MKNRKRRSLKETAYRFLFEQEEEEDAAGDIFGGEEEEADDAAEGEEADDAAEGDEGAEDEEAEDVDVSSVEEYALSDSIDQELDALFVDFEHEARKSAVVNQSDELAESLGRRLLEATADDIDLRDFAGNVARLVKNYQNLIDWESVILNKAETFVNNHYGEDTVKVLFDILEAEYDIAKKVKEEAPLETPVAVGAYGEAGGAQGKGPS